MYVDILLRDENMISFNEFIDFDLKQNTSDNNEILLGNASASSLNFSIWNDKQYNIFRFKGSTCYLYKDIERTQKMGVFNVDKITKDKTSLKFECTDFMTKLDDTFKGVQTPFTIFSLIVQICAQLGIQLRNTEEDFAHLTQSYNDTNLILGKKCRDVIKWISEITCKYAIFDEEGKLFFSWYDLNTIKKEIPYNKLKEFARDEEELNITKVSVVLDNEEVVEGLEEGYDLRLSTDNPFLKPLSIDNRTAILQDIQRKVYGMKYLSCDISIAVDDDIKVGDTLGIYDEDGNYYKILCTYLNINKIFSMKITSAGENVNRNSENNGGGDSGSSNEEKTYISKDENWREITISNFVGETFLNSISIFGVTEKSSAFLSYTLELESHVEKPIIFKMYINDVLAKEIEFYARVGMNVFNWSETANIRFADETNTFKFTLDTTSLADESFFFNIKKEKSILSIISTGARAGSNAITNLEFKEEVKKITLTNIYDELIFRDFSETIDININPWIDNSITESIGIINFKTSQKMTIENINEIVE